MKSPDRIEALDALRGLALFGVLMVNLLTAFRLSLFTFYFGPAEEEGTVRALLEWTLEFKSMVVFSLLFGVGMEIQRQRQGSRFLPRQTRRLLVLLAFGLIHLGLIWNGDILTLYALLGLLAMPLLRLPAAPLALLALACLALSCLPFPLHLPDLPSHQQAALLNYRGDFARVQSFRLQELPYIASLLAGSAARTLGLFLLGGWLWRQRHLPLHNLGWLCLAVGLANQPGDPLACVAMGLGYVTLFAALWRTCPGALRWAAPVGRMAFTNYLTQSLLLGWIFYGYGLGLFGRLTLTQAVPIGIVIYALQVAWSHVWLKHYPLGPLEWLWRRLSRSDS